METEPEESRTSRSTATYGITAFVLLYLLSPPALMVPLYVWHGGPSKLPPQAKKIEGIYKLPGGYIARWIPAYGHFVQWQWKTFYKPMFP